MRNHQLLIINYQLLTINMTRPITPYMIRRLHVLYAKHGLGEEQYRALIGELTDGRTASTKGLTYAEAQYLAGYITGANTKLRTSAEKITLRSLKWQRSAVLKRMQQIGVDTTDWTQVNAFLRQPRIAGKNLYQLDSEELSALIPKLEAIKKKLKENGQTV